MKSTLGSIASVAPAAPGSHVRISDLPDEGFPIVAWAVVCTHVASDEVENSLQPVFVVDGDLYTTFEWYRAEGPERGVTVVIPR
ncbi:hypothetical protein [Streptomyces sp. NRRL S-4]|uniref:hypothetical protein n=1 Tax=Streptomyces sp. NRRL S-4 TaxID=1519471 RepID=UPI0006B64FD1|nr:hypothetical protein [Streptomyces sp. NRRL S-4]KPC79538.1 hypothetical protein ADK82_25760 [Streptomyces sp. NRRL S-4]